MRVAIVSDSHDSIKNLGKVVEQANTHRCQYLFHLGDIISPYTARVLSSFQGKIKAVFGNCDGDKLGLQRVFESTAGEIKRAPFALELSGKRILLMHEPDLIDELITSQQFDYIFYGHLHKRDYHRVKDTTILNPGESAGIMNPPGFYIADLIKGEFTPIDL